MSVRTIDDDSVNRSGMILKLEFGMEDPDEKEQRLQCERAMHELAIWERKFMLCAALAIFGVIAVIAIISLFYFSENSEVHCWATAALTTLVTGSSYLVFQQSKR